MAQLTLSDLDEDLVRRLELRAAQHGRSAEAEHREILRQALRSSSSKSFRDFLLSIPALGEDADFARDRDLGRPVEL
ncbi:MAG: DNA-binding protein [Acidobacteria bacterium]|nr:DNA-binding protein [Acidobacteriota bacterium]